MFNNQVATHYRRFNAPRNSIIVLGILMIGAIYPLCHITANILGTISFYLLNIIIFLTAILWILRIMVNDNELRLFPAWPLLVIILGCALYVTITYDEFVNLNFRAVKITKYGMYCLLLLMTYSSFRDPRQMVKFFRVFVFSSSILSMLAIAQYFSGLSIIYDVKGMMQEQNRLFDGEGTNPNMLVNVYLFSISYIIMVITLTKLTRWKRIYYLGLFALQLIPFILLQSRGAIIGLMISLAMVFCIFTKGRLLFKSKWLPILIGLTIGSIIYFLLPYLDTERFSEQYLVEYSLNHRFTLWQAAGTIVLNNPFATSYDNYGSQISMYFGKNSTPHNLVLFTAIEIGIIGCVAFFWLFYYCGYQIIKSRSRNENTNNLIVRCTVLSGLVAYIIHNMSHNPGWEYELWIFLAFALCLNRQTWKIRKPLAFRGRHVKKHTCIPRFRTGS